MRHYQVRLAILHKFTSQADFSLAVGEDESRVSRVIRGRRKLSRDEAQLWCEALGCDVKFLEPVMENKGKTKE